VIQIKEDTEKWEFFPLICYRVRDIDRASTVREGIRTLNLAHAYSVVVFVVLFSVA